MATLDERTSRSHAQVLIGADGTFVRDLDSTYGTAVNGQRITHDRALQDGDRVTFGSITMTYRAVSPPRSE